MKLFSAEEIRKWDQYTIDHEPILSVDLMERAAAKCVLWLETNNYTDKPFQIFCGKGNNGGDGLAIARMLSARGLQVTVHILEFGHKGTEDFQVNLARLHQDAKVNIRFIQTEENFPAITDADIVVDALFGSGLNRGLDGVTAELVKHINKADAAVIAIDIPSGLFCDHSSLGAVVVRADHTLTFQSYKLALLMPENSQWIGAVHVLDIGLHPGFYRVASTNYEWIDLSLVHTIYQPRNSFSHKGNFGHALIIAGSYGKMGAAILAAGACLRSGVGLLTCHIPKCGYEILQTALPEAMITTDFNSSFITRIEESVSAYSALGIGPGIGKASETRIMLQDVLKRCTHPIVLDADALNILAMQKDLLETLPGHSILTPHPKEFERIFGEIADDFEKLQVAIQKSKELNVIIVLKGHHTLIATPGGEVFFNSTGNAGMATGGSGDVLTGILTGLLAQRYSPRDAAVLGVYIHGLAGDLAAEKLSQEAMIAGDIIDHLPNAFLRLSTC